MPSGSTVPLEPRLAGEAHLGVEHEPTVRSRGPRRARSRRVRRRRGARGRGDRVAAPGRRRSGRAARGPSRAARRCTSRGRRRRGTRPARCGGDRRRRRRSRTSVSSVPPVQLGSVALACQTGEDASSNLVGMSPTAVRPIARWIACGERDPFEREQRLGPVVGDDDRVDERVDERTRQARGHRRDEADPQRRQARREHRAPGSAAGG